MAAQAFEGHLFFALREPAVRQERMVRPAVRIEVREEAAAEARVVGLSGKARKRRLLVPRNIRDIFFSSKERERERERESARKSKDVTGPVESVNQRRLSVVACGVLLV